MPRILVTSIALFFLLFSSDPAASAPVLRVEKGVGQMAIYVGTQPIASYVWQDEEVPRPYFANLTTIDGIPVTRNHPPDPVQDKDNDDHATYHPGVWLAFGDISGVDFWRNKARVRHVRFSEDPQVEDGQLRFAVVDAWETTDSPARMVCESETTYTLRSVDTGYLLTADIRFKNKDHAFTFGDQEEMGFGVRLATPLTVRHGDGHIINSAGGQQEKGTWGKRADWCAGYGVQAGRRVGINVLTSPGNFRPSWFHSRDYGLIVANAFGKKAMTGPGDASLPADSTPVDAGDTLRLRFGVCVFSVPEKEQPDWAGMHQRYVDAQR